jgi:hypothetical protein
MVIEPKNLHAMLKEKTSDPTSWQLFPLTAINPLPTTFRLQTHIFLHTPLRIQLAVLRQEQNNTKRNARIKIPPSSLLSLRYVDIGDLRSNTILNSAMKRPPKAKIFPSVPSSTDIRLNYHTSSHRESTITVLHTRQYKYNADTCLNQRAEDIAS